MSASPDQGEACEPAGLARACIHLLQLPIACASVISVTLRCCRLDDDHADDAIEDAPAGDEDAADDDGEEEEEDEGNVGGGKVKHWRIKTSHLDAKVCVCDGMCP